MSKPLSARVHELSRLNWRWIVALTVTMGVLNGLYPRTLLLNPVFGLFLCIYLWFPNRPSTRWYDVFFFACLLTCALVAWVVSIGACSVWELLGFANGGCTGVASARQLLGTAAFVLIPGVILYVATYVFLFAGRLRSTRKA